MPVNIEPLDGLRTQSEISELLEKLYYAGLRYVSHFATKE
jgi:hypothetical protein